MVDGAAIEAAALVTGENVLDNPLKRQLQGYFITDSDAAVTIYRSDWTQRTITLVSSGAATVNVWVY